MKSQELFQMSKDVGSSMVLLSKAHNNTDLSKQAEFQRAVNEAHSQIAEAAKRLTGMAARLQAEGFVARQLEEQERVDRERAHAAAV